MSDVQLTFYSLSDLFDQCKWIDFFSDLEKIIHCKLSHLDTADPIRRKVDDLSETADFICLIGERETSRRLFGKFGKSKISIAISIYKDVSGFPNRISLGFPEKILSENEGAKTLHRVFVMANHYFKPFYSIGDIASVITSKRKITGFAVNLQAELIGIFWLTYLNRSYVDFFGKEKFNNLHCECLSEEGGLLVKLGDSPFSLDVSRDEMENYLGRASFVEPLLNMDKEIGKNALLYKQITN